MTTPPADPGWETADDTCPAHYRPGGELNVELWPGFRCEGEAGHIDRGEPHTVTLVWFDPVAEPTCTSCADTGQVAGQPCPEHCSAAHILAGEQAEPPEPSDAVDRRGPDPATLGGWSTPDPD